MIKMWGTVSSSANVKDCTSHTLITGYVTMVVGTTVNLVANTNCALTTNAKIQWITSALFETTGGMSTKVNLRNSFVILHGGEDWYCGNNGGTCTTDGTKPNYYAVGGATGIISNGLFGVGTYQIYAMYTDYEGELAGTETG